MKKFLLGCLIALALVGYFGRDYINLLRYVRYAKLSEGCLTVEEEQKLRTKNGSYNELDVIARKNFDCIKEKQNFIERIFIPIPDDWVTTESSKE